MTNITSNWMCIS